MFLVMILLAVLGVLSMIFSVFGFKSNKKILGTILLISGLVFLLLAIFLALPH